MSAVDPRNEVTNAIAHIQITLDIPREKLIELVGLPDDEERAEGGWYERACEAAEAWIADNETEAIAWYATGSEASCE